MNTVDDLVFRVKGKSVNAPMSEIKALPEEERRKAYMRLKALGSAVAGFTGMAAKMPTTVAAMGGAGAAPRARSPSPKPAAKPEPKPKKPKKEIKSSGEGSFLYPDNVTEFKEVMKRHDIEPAGKVILADPKYGKELRLRLKRKGREEIRVVKRGMGFGYDIHMSMLQGHDSILIHITEDGKITSPADLAAVPLAKKTPRQPPGSAIETHIEDALFLDLYRKEDTVNHVVRAMKKAGYTDKQILKAMKDKGITLFDDYIEEHS